MKKENKMTKIISTVIVILIILGAFLWYPWFVEVNKNGETICSNILGFKSKC